VNILTNVENPESLSKISVSEAYTLMRCKKKHDYAYRQGLSLAQPPSYLGKGNYLHRLMRVWLTLWADGSPTSNVEELSNRTLREIVEEGSPITVAESDRVEVNAVFGQFLRDVGPQMGGVAILAIEQPFYADLGWTEIGPDGQEVLVVLHGVFDAVLQDISSGQVWIVEHKSTGRAWSASQLQFAHQGKLYADAWATIKRQEITGIQYNFFYPKGYEIKQTFVSSEERELLRHEMQMIINQRSTSLLQREPHWGCNDCWFKDLCITELVGGDSDYLRRTKYVVDEEKVARFAEEGT
jgi:CRISPR/Cas system-associated exonuclease Cas4 (RecB family)